MVFVMIPRRETQTTWMEGKLSGDRGIIAQVVGT